MENEQEISDSMKMDDQKNTPKLEYERIMTIDELTAWLKAHGAEELERLPTQPDGVTHYTLPIDKHGGHWTVSLNTDGDVWYGSDKYNIRDIDPRDPMKSFNNFHELLDP